MSNAMGAIVRRRLLIDVADVAPSGLGQVGVTVVDGAPGAAVVVCTSK